ncbi:MAG TPA: mechanosensitive ion channel [Candidatus Nanopelagicales bacterium]|nr:mechanosensitive ion channel [Candidatus Nanopelagicales bacterium]
MRRLTEPLLRRRGRSDSSAAVFARLASWVFLALGVGAALTITFPSVKPVHIVGGVGVLSIAAGIAFQTVLGNMFAGIVILGKDKYRVGIR